MALDKNDPEVMLYEASVIHDIAEAIRNGTLGDTHHAIAWRLERLAEEVHLQSISKMLGKGG